MATSRKELSPEEQDRQAALDRSWDAAQKTLSDPESRSRLERSIDRVKDSTAPLLTREEFLEQTEPPAG